MKGSGAGFDQYLTAREVWALTGVPTSTLHDWAQRRERGESVPGPRHLRMSPRHRRWMRADVISWLESCRAV